MIERYKLVRKFGWLDIVLAFGTGVLVGVLAMDALLNLLTRGG